MKGAFFKSQKQTITPKVELGIDLSTIQSIVGHADIDMTQHYLHVQDNVRQEAVERFSEAFGEKSELHE